MTDTERLLEEAGERWRESLGDVPEIDPARFAARRSPPSRATVLVTGAMGVAVAVVAGIAVNQWVVRSPAGAEPPGSTVSSVQPSQSGNAGTGGQVCAVTTPDPALVPPPPFLPSPPEYYGSDWFGSPALWTMIDRDGEIWKQSDLPHGPEGLGQKTFWWSVDWDVQAELEPAITVVGTRLDGSGGFTSRGGTNASADFGTAMLIGADFPSPGCWQLTGRYRDAELWYVVWITDD